MVDRLYVRKVSTDTSIIESLVAKTDGLLFVGVHLLCFDFDGLLEQARHFQTEEGKSRAKSRSYIDAAKDLIASIEAYNLALENLLQEGRFPVCFLFECEEYLESTLSRLSAFAPNMVWVVILTETGGVHLEGGLTYAEVADTMHRCGATKIALAGTYINHLSPTEQDGCVLHIGRELVRTPHFEPSNVVTNPQLFVNARVYE